MNKEYFLLSAVWCGACRIVKPILNEISQEENITIQEIEADSPEGIEFRKKYSFSNLPTVIVVDTTSGEELSRLVGRKNKEEYLTILKSNDEKTD